MCIKVLGKYQELIQRRWGNFFQRLAIQHAISLSCFRFAMVEKLDNRFV